MKKQLIAFITLILFWGYQQSATAQTCPTTISAFPHTQDFESGTSGSPGTLPTGWTINPSSGHAWYVENGPTASLDTGPDVDHTTGTSTGKYVFTETSSGTTGAVAELISPCIDLTGLTTPGFDFWYHMAGVTIGTLEVEVSTNNGTTWTNLFTLTGAQQTSETDPWLKKTISLGNYTGVIQLRFKGTRGTSFTGDIAIDDVKIYNIPANDAGVTSITSPASPVAPNTSVPVTVTVKNFGGSPLTSAVLGFSVNGTTVVNNFSFNPATALASNQTSAPVTIGNYSFPAGSYIVKAWSSSPNGAADGDVSTDTATILLSSCTALSGTYTINQNLASSATNFQSFAAVSQAIGSCGINGPVTFNVVTGSGPYNEQVILPVVPGASATNRVTFNGNGNTIEASPGSNFGILTLDGADFITFDNFVLTLDAAATQGWGVQFLNQADNNIISNNTIDLPISSTSTGYIGIGTGATYTTYGNNANNNIIQNNIINGGYYGIRMNGTSSSVSSVGNDITGNQIKDSYYYALAPYYQSGGLIEGNDISRANRSDGSTFYSLYQYYSPSMTISKNRIHDIGGSTIYGIYNYYSDSPVGSESVISNNLIYNLNNTGTTYAIYSASSDGAHFYHNTIDLDNTSNTGTVRGFYQTTAATNVRFINNIVTINSGSTGTKHAIYFGTTTSAITSNNNVFMVNGGTSSSGIGYRSGNQATLADWQGASSQDAGSVVADPQYVNTGNGNLKPTSSTVNNIGQPVPAVTTDILGVTRNTTAPDPGAYEFTPAANDAGIIAIVTPVSPVTPGVSQPVQVTIKNMGLSPLTSATINWSVNGNLQTPYSWTNAGLANNQTANTTIGNYTFPAGSYTLSVWTSNPNGVTDGIPGNDTTTVHISSCNALSGNFTIDKNAASSATNFVSMSDAAQALTNCGVSGAVTIDVVAGSGPYTDQLMLTAIPGASATNTITINGNGNTISANPGMLFGIVTLDGADFVTINNFILTPSAAASSAWGVQLLNQADNNTISNNTINLPVNNTSTSYIGIGAGVTYSTYGNNTNNTKIQNNIINGGYYGIRLNGTSSSVHSVGNEITGNLVRDPYYYGIAPYYNSGTIIANNEISRANRTDGSTFYALYPYYSPSATVSKNRIHSIGGSTIYGIYTYYADSPVGSESVVSNNLIYNLSNTGSTYVLYNASSDGTHYYHNTVAIDNQANTGLIRGFYQTTAASNIVFANNLISIEGGMSGAEHAIYLNTTSSSVTSNNNVFYVTGGAAGSGVGSWGSSSQATLADWQTASAQDANSVSVNPAFVNPAAGNFKPTTVAVNNIGQPVPGVTTDITGATRNTTAPDPGAYEFDVVANDVAVVAIVTPNSVCGLSATETVTITIKNLGSTTQTSIPVSYTVAGPVVSSGSGTYTGSIAPNGTDNFTFTQPADLSVAGGYTITASTALTGDVLPANDDTTKMVTNSLMGGLPINLNFETPATGLAAMKVVTNSRSTVMESAAASNGTGSTKGIIMSGVTSTTWSIPAGSVNPWTVNPQHLSGVYICFPTSGLSASDSLWLTFDLQQHFDLTNANTNFRVTVNGQPIGGNGPNNTYRPPFSGGTAVWEKIKLDLTAYKSQSTIEIGLESSVAEEYANGTGPANMIDNVQVVTRIVNSTKNDFLQKNLSVFPNPSEGTFFVELPKGKAYSLEVTDLNGKVIKTQTAAAGKNILNLEGTSKGVYLLKVSSKDGMAVKKLIVD